MLQTQHIYVIIHINKNQGGVIAPHKIKGML
jgi:hypothetical protein